MNIGIRLHDAAGVGLEEKLRSARAQGFTCAHIAMQKVVPGFKMMDAPSLLTPELAREVRALLEKYGMHCAVLGCYLNLATPDPKALEETVACYKAHLRFAKWIGADVVGTETGAPNTTYTTVPECYTEESLQLFIERVTPVVRYAEELEQDFAIEPVIRHIVSDNERAMRVLEAVNSPRLRIILDTVNLLNRANAEQADSIVEDAVSRFGERISVLHMKDWQPIPGDTEVKSLACGLGNMDYTRLVAFALQHPGIPMTLEDTKPENAEAARLCLESYAAAADE